MHSLKMSMSPCRECNRYVYSTEPFDILPVRIGGVYFARVVHRACNYRANHSKDGK